MAPHDGIQLPLRWEFVPCLSRYGTIEWEWRAFRQNGDLAMKSGGSFPTFTECEADAANNGYQTRSVR